MSRLVSKKELAELLGVAQSAIDFMMEKEQIPYMVVGPRKALRFSYQDVLECLPGRQPATKYHKLKSEIGEMTKLLKSVTERLEQMERALDDLIDTPPPLTKLNLHQADLEEDEYSSEEDDSSDDSSEESDPIKSMFDGYVGDAHRGFPKF